MAASPLAAIRVCDISPAHPADLTSVIQAARPAAAACSGLLCRFSKACCCPQLRGWQHRCAAFHTATVSTDVLYWHGHCRCCRMDAHPDQPVHCLLLQLNSPLHYAGDLADGAAATQACAVERVLQVRLSDYGMSVLYICC